MIDLIHVNQPDKSSIDIAKDKGNETKAKMDVLPESADLFEAQQKVLIVETMIESGVLA